ncbi:hypothetical protein BDZ91DRAFT_716303 [Kalaharituber pfeilii]|nr:hypothetical protein BDZ91DRAFT_716303 [Kalaharituber pfeilii]
MSSVPIVPSRGLGFFVLGTSIYDILTEIRNNPSQYPSSALIYDSQTPLSSNVIVNLEMNGLRLRFDGADQRLRLIEVTSFQKSRLSYNGSELARNGQSPTFRYIYNKLFGPTYPGEYLSDQSIYILSYPGIAFSFPVDKDQWKEDVDLVSLLSATNAQPAISMAIFHGQSWAEARNQLFTKPPINPRNPNVTSLSAKQSPANDEIELVRVYHSTGKVELVRRHNPSYFITLHSTTPQDLVTELGPPSSIYHKNDHRLSIHRAHGGGGSGAADEIELEADPLTQSDNGESEDDDDSDSGSTDYFYNYFGHGFDVFISTSAGHVASKVILHGNVPGSYEFNRYRRCRWEIIYGEDSELANSINGNQNSTGGVGADLGVSEVGVAGEYYFGGQTTSGPGGSASTPAPTTATPPLNSEMCFDEINERLKEKFGATQKPMLLNRASDSPSSSVELLGGWEEGDLRGAGSAEEAFGNTELYGFPGLIFEALRNRAVSSLTVF